MANGHKHCLNHPHARVVQEHATRIPTWTRVIHLYTPGILIALESTLMITAINPQTPQPILILMPEVRRGPKPLPSVG